MTDTEMEYSESSLKGRVRQGLRWSFVNTIGVRVMSFVSGIILARILAPDDFGAYAAAIAIVNILFGWNDLGMLLALVRWQGDLKVAARTAMTLSLVPSVGIYVVCFLAAPAFADVMNSPRSAGILRLIALTVVLDGAVAVPQGLLVRSIAQKRMAFIEFTAVPVNVCITVTLAVAGVGPWSLAIGQVAGNLVSAVLLTAAAPFRVRPGFDPKVARSMLSFGVPLAFTSLVEYMLLNADYVIVGSLLGPVALGFYLIAYNVSNWPVNLLSDAIRRVSIAGFAHLSKDDEVAARRNFNRTYALLLTVTLPLIMALSLLGPELVRFVYGGRWAPSGHVLRSLALLAGARIAVGFIFDLLVGAGRTRTTFVLQCIWLVVLVPALAVGAEIGGIRGVGVAHALVALGIAAPLFLRAVSRYGVDLRDLGRRLLRPAVGGAVVLAGGLVLVALVNGVVLRLLLVGPAIGLTYGVITVPRQAASDAIARVRSRRGTPAAAEATVAETLAPEAASTGAV